MSEELVNVFREIKLLALAGSNERIMELCNEQLGVLESLLTMRAADDATGCAHRAPRVIGVGLFICDDCGKTLHR